jgi:periplasmic divalent cation tolerance protein
MQDDIRIVYVTCPDPETGEAIAGRLVEERLAACVNVVPGLRSVYRWRGEIEIDDEVLLLIKTAAARFEALCRRVRELHPDEVPEIVAVPVAEGLDDYLQWVRDETRPG